MGTWSAFRSAPKAKRLHIQVLLCILYMIFGVTGNVQLGEYLRVGQPWKSPGGTFAIGFHLAAAHNYNLAIWYECEKNNSTDHDQKTVVWTFKGDDGQPFELSSQASLQLTSSGLKLTSSTSPAIIAGTSVASASMNEDGNFVLLQSDGNTVWESFGYPINTLLPNQQLITSLHSTSEAYSLIINRGQVFLRNNVINIPKKYWSISNPAINSTRTCLDDNDGELVIKGCTVDSILKSSTPVLNLSSDGALKFYDGSGTSWYKSTTVNFQRYALDYGNPNVQIRRLSLDDDGNLRMYSMSSQNDSWTVVWQAVLKECDVFGICGPFALCTYRPHKTCSCPPGFHKLDATDDSKGCDYNVPFHCGSQIRLVLVNRGDYYYNDYDFNAKIMSLEECKELCLRDCKCLAFTYKFGYGLCFLKGGSTKLYSGKQSFDQSNVVYMKLSLDDTSAQDDHTELFISDTNATLVDSSDTGASATKGYISKHPGTVLLFVAIAELIIFIIAAAFLCIHWRKKARRIWKELTQEIEGTPTKFSYKKLQAATQNFSTVLGSGGFSTVFKGEIPEKGGAVAVKVIHTAKATQAEKQFEAEVSTIGRVHHVNLVRLLGYCAEGSHRLLVYEYMPNGSLDKTLFSSEDVVHSFFCEWHTRFSITSGIAKGIAYLHEQCHDCIMHCDIKPQNILLDENFHPKVADFGLAKLVNKDKDLHTITTIRGTRGYAAPEWLTTSQVTAKADVYSFGMLLLEILSGRDKLRLTPSALETNHAWYFPDWAFQRFMASDLSSIADSKLANVDWEQFTALVKIAFWCIQRDASSRPAMSHVVQMLEENESAIPTPPLPRIFDINSEE